MDSHLSEEALWASGMAARLRVLQTTLADDEPSTRRSFITQELEQALKGSVPERRQAFLDALSRQFPAWQASAPPPPAAPVPEPAPQSPEELLGQVLELLPGLQPELKAEFAKRLQAAGILPESNGAGSLQVAPEVLKRVGLQPGAEFDAARVAKTFAMLLDAFLLLDQLVWRLWREIAPGSMFRKESDLPKLAGEYLKGSTEVSGAQLMQGIDKTRTLIASLLGATGPAFDTFADATAKLFDPPKISDAARPEKGVMESIEFASWRKYRQLYSTYLLRDILAKAIKESFAKNTENLCRGVRTA